jgi:hypothetical protein
VTDNLDNILELTDSKPENKSINQNIQKEKPKEKTNFHQPENIGISEEDVESEEEEEEEESEEESERSVKPVKHVQQKLHQNKDRKINKRMTEVKPRRNEDEVRLMQSEPRAKKTGTKSFSVHGALSSETNDRSHRQYSKKKTGLQKITEEEGDRSSRKKPSYAASK